MKSCALSCTFCLFVTVSISATANDYFVETLQFPGSTETAPQDINNAGIVVGAYFDADEISHGFVWQDGEFRSPELGLEDVLFTAINEQGVIAGSGFDFLGLSIPSFTIEDAVVETFSYPGAFITFAEGINSAGTVTGVFIEDLDLGPFGAFIKQGDQYDAITIPDYTEVIATDINDAGVVVGGAYNALGDESGYIFENGEITIVDHPDGDTELSAINNLGVVVGSVFPIGEPARTFFYEDGEFTDINLPDIGEFAAWGLNDAGVLVGTYFQDDEVLGFIATPIPEPSSVAMLLAGIGLLTFRQRRLRKPFSKMR